MPSREPSSTTSTSYEREERVDSRCASVVENMVGSRSVSL